MPSVGKKQRLRIWTNLSKSKGAKKQLKSSKFRFSKNEKKERTRTKYPFLNGTYSLGMVCAYIFPNSSHYFLYHKCQNNFTNAYLWIKYTSLCRLDLKSIFCLFLLLIRWIRVHIGIGLRRFFTKKRRN